MKNKLSRLPRRLFIKNATLYAGAALILPQLPSFVPGTHASPTDLLILDASIQPPAASTTGFHLGTVTAPGGHSLVLDSRSLVRDGQPWVFMSGEFHFSRCPEPEWRDELLKMKAGGISLVTTYIFWILLHR